VVRTGLLSVDFAYFVLFSLEYRAMRCRQLCVLLLFVFCLCAFAQSPARLQQPSSQNPSPMVENTRAHGRVARNEVAGQRYNLSVGTLLLPRTAKLRPQMPLFIHFHGATWLVEQSVADRNSSAAVLTVNLGAGSGVYSRAFQDPDRFRQLLDEAAHALDAQHPPQFRPIVISSFSAGYGAVREILKNHENWPRIKCVVLVDGLHTGYIPDGAPGPLDPVPLQPFLEFARAAADGEKCMVITHSEIFPGTFASTTETADYLLQALKLRPKPVLKWGPGGMQQLSDLHVRGLHVLGFAGNSAPDHVDQLHGLKQWLKLAKD
jgi:hypothetical protein